MCEVAVLCIFLFFYVAVIVIFMLLVGSGFSDLPCHV
jgi:hypothetical protein